MHESKVAQIVDAALRPRNDVIERRRELGSDLIVDFTVQREPVTAE